MSCSCGHTLVERIRLAAAALLLIGGAGRPNLTLFDIGDEEATVLLSDGWSVHRYTKGANTWFSLTRNVDGVEAWAFTKTRPAVAWEIDNVQS